MKITFIRLWYIFLYLTSLNSFPANSKHVYCRQLDSTLTCAKCSRIGVLNVTPGNDKGGRCASQKYHKHFMSGAMELFRHHSWLRFILKPSLEKPCLWYCLAKQSRPSGLVCVRKTWRRKWWTASQQAESLPFWRRSLPLKKHRAGDYTRAGEGRAVAVYCDCPVRLYQTLGRKGPEAIS